eukprot:scaffold1972_cov265-Chaetoceros_neogracile.AAC.47
MMYTHSYVASSFLYLSEEHTLRKIDIMISDAKARMAKGDKKGALYAMKRKKLHETELDKIQNVKMTLETQVDDLMDDIREEMEMANEISEAIGQPVDPFANDEDELLAELEQMGADDLEAELLKAPIAKNEFLLPSVPDQELPDLNNAEAEEMKKLEAELAGL